MAGRKTRKELVGREEGIEQEARDEQYAKLAVELHSRWWTGEDGPLDEDDDTE